MWNRLTNNNTQVWSWATYEYLNNNLNQYTTQSWTTQNYIIQEIVEEIQTETQTESGTIYGTGTQITYTWSLVTTTTNTNYTYDDNWNLTNDWNYKYIYDYKNRLVKVTNQDDELIVEYTYDILDRRYKKETSTKLVQYTYSNENIVKEEITDKINTTTQTKTYINWLWIDNVIAYDLDNTRYYYHKNHLWSIDWLTDSNWNQVITYDYDVYWNTYVLDNWNRVNIINYTWSTFENDRLYTWREYDKEIWLYYNRARYYSPELGRFISRDPIDIQDDVNLYAYVGNNPVNYLDLMGLGKTLIIGFKWLDLSGYWEIEEENYRRDWVWSTLNDLKFDDKYKGKIDMKYYDSTPLLWWIIWWEKSARDYIIENKDKYNKIIILWHSQWADSAVELANSLEKENITVNLLVTIDLQAIYDTTTVQKNTNIAINYYQTNILTGANGDTLDLSNDNNNTKLYNIEQNNYCSAYKCEDVKENYDFWHTIIDDKLKPKILSNIISVINN